jgi:hypothetical protein
MGTLRCAAFRDGNLAEGRHADVTAGRLSAGAVPAGFGRVTPSFAECLADPRRVTTTSAGMTCRRTA